LASGHHHRADDQKRHEYDSVLRGRDMRGQSVNVGRHQRAPPPSAYAPSARKVPVLGVSDRVMTSIRPVALLHLSSLHGSSGRLDSKGFAARPVCRHRPPRPCTARDFCDQRGSGCRPDATAGEPNPVSRCTSHDGHVRRPCSEAPWAPEALPPYQAHCCLHSWRLAQRRRPRSPSHALVGRRLPGRTTLRYAVLRLASRRRTSDSPPLMPRTSN
jgi:hypothetical protein